MSETSHDPNQMSGAAMIVRALIDHGVKHIFGYPGGAALERLAATGDPRAYDGRPSASAPLEPTQQ